MPSALPKQNYGTGYRYSESGTYKYTPVKDTGYKTNRRGQGYTSTVEKSRKVTLLFWFFCGVSCCHNFYLGRVRKGLWLLTLPWIFTFIIVSLMVISIMEGTMDPPRNKIIFMGTFGVLFTGMFINWLVELYQIFKGTIKDDRGRQVIFNK